MEEGDTAHAQSWAGIQKFLPLPGNLDSQNVSRKGLFLKQNGLWRGKSKATLFVGVAGGRRNEAPGSEFEDPTHFSGRHQGPSSWSRSIALVSQLVTMDKS